MILVFEIHEHETTDNVRLCFNFETIEPSQLFYSYLASIIAGNTCLLRGETILSISRGANVQFYVRLRIYNDQSTAFRWTIWELVK